MAPSLRTFSQSLPMTLLRTREAVMARFREHLNRHGVTEQQWRVLRALHADRSVTAAGLAQATLIKPPSLSRILRDLETRQWIVRRESDRDQRAVLVRLSRRGAEFLERAGPESEACYRAMSETIGEERLARLYRVLGEVLERLEPAGSAVRPPTAVSVPRSRRSASRADRARTS